MRSGRAVGPEGRAVIPATSPVPYAALTERLGRWSARQRSEADQRARVVRWLIDEAGVTHRMIQDQHPTVNATVDYRRAGGSERAWLTRYDMACESWYRNGREGRVWVPGVKVEPYDPASVRLPDAPVPSDRTFVAWWVTQSVESFSALQRYTGRTLRLDPSMTLPARGPGMSSRTVGWSATHLDRVHPDGTCSTERPARRRRAKPTTSPEPVNGSRSETVRALVVDGDDSHRLGTARVRWDGERPTFAVDRVELDGSPLKLSTGSTLYVVVGLRRR